MVPLGAIARAIKDTLLPLEVTQTPLVSDRVRWAIRQASAAA